MSQQLEFSGEPQEKVISPLFKGFYADDRFGQKLRKVGLKNEFSIAVMILWISVYEEGVL